MCHLFECLARGLVVEIEQSFGTLLSQLFKPRSGRRARLVVSRLTNRASGREQQEKQREQFRVLYLHSCKPVIALSPVAPNPLRSVPAHPDLNNVPARRRSLIPHPATQSVGSLASVSTDHQSAWAQLAH